MATFQQPPQPIAPGTQGRPVTVKTNSFVVTSLPKKTFYHYDVVIVKLVHKGVAKNDPPTRKQVKLQQRYMEIINKMHDENPREFQPRPSYDGVKNMFSSVKHQNKTFHVTMPGGKYEVSIKLVNELGPHLFQELIRPGSHMIETVTQRSKPIADASTDIAPLNKNVAAVMLLQVVVTQAPHIHHKFSLHSRSFYIESRAKPLSGGLEALPGFFQSVRPVLGKYLINVDTTTAAFYKAGSLLRLAAEHLGVMDYRNLANALGSRAKQSSLRTFLRGLKVIVVPGETNINMRPNPDLHRVVDIKDLHYNVGSITFNGPNGEETIKDYWERVHQSRLTCPDAFGISSGRDAIFPAEKCYVVAGQRFSRKLSPNDMRQFLGLAVSQPQARIDSIEKAIQGEHLDYRNSSWIHDADIRIDSRALQIQGREISPPQIGYGGKRDLNVARGQWNVMRQKFFVPREIKAMAVLDFDSQSQNIPRHVDAFITKLLDNLEALGIKVLRDNCLYRTGNQQNPRASLEMTAREASSHLPPNTRPDMIVVILPAEAGPIRHAIKYWGDVYYGLATQCVRNGKYNRGGMSALDQYCNNVALKINTKLGGTNSIFRFPAVENCLTHSMVVGCDISHPAPGVRNRPSIASLVASIDSVCTRYTAHVRCQEPRQEVIEDLKGMLGDAITDFRGRFNGNVPKRIIIFRDGVSEGEYQRVLDNEINKQVEAALWALNPRPPYKPQIVFIVVGKRHHVRFFPVDRSSGDSKGNCNPGLVVDTEIVHSQYQSFYLLSHAGILGTSRPSHYVVLRNDPKWNADELQAISYALCHVYAPATRSVSIPAPVYYADKLCTHAVDQFEPEGDEAHYDDSLSGVGSHDNEMFNLEAWKARLKPANEAVRQRMYYV